MILSVYLHGGLGNQLFQLAFLQNMHERTHGRISIDPAFVVPSPHSADASYLSTIFAHFQSFKGKLVAYREIMEKPNMEYDNWYRYRFIFPGGTLLFRGYFQRYEYIPRSFPSLLRFNTEVAANYPRLHESAFLHIRGGDYLIYRRHFIDLSGYYKRAIEFYKSRGVQHFYVFTNDKAYAESLAIVDESTMTYMEEPSEVDELYLMTQCKQGGICANSSFSWWGGYLNQARPIVLPSKWYSDDMIDTTCLYYPGSTVIMV